MAQSFWRRIMIQRSLRGAGRFRLELFLIVAGCYHPFTAPNLRSVRTSIRQCGAVFFPSFTAQVSKLNLRFTEVLDQNEMDAASAIAWLDWWQRVNTVLALEAETDVTIPDEVARLAQDRENARREKNWKRSDELREQISVLGWEVRDTKDGSKLTRAAGSA